jgi:hypothetical protein
MGLDWCLLPKARPGFEAEFLSLTAAIEMERDEANRDVMNNELRKISVSPGETLEAPRVGIDACATEWFVKHCKERAEILRRFPDQGLDGPDSTYWLKPIEELLKDNHGMFVIDLADYNKSVITGVMGGNTSFRGKIIGCCEFLDERLKEEAYEDHICGTDVLDYKRRLQKDLFSWIRGYALDPKIRKRTTDDDIYAEQVNLRKMPDEDIETILRQAERERERKFKVVDQISASGAKAVSSDLSQIQTAVAIMLYEIDALLWLDFWGNKGHGFWAWY